MVKLVASLLATLFVLVLAVAACSATPTPLPTPIATQALTLVPPTVPPSPTMTPTSIPASTLLPPSLTPLPLPTSVPTSVPTATSLPPSPAPLLPIKLPASATPLRPPAPQGSIAYHWNDNGINRASIYNFVPQTTTPLAVIGYSMDLELGTNAHLGEWSPDDSQFAYVYTRLLGWPEILRVIDFKTGTIIPLYTSESGGGLSSPTWAPDGKRVAFIRMLKNQSGWSIDVVNSDGTGLTEIRGNPEGEQYRGGVSWSKQNVLVFAQNLNGPSNIFTMNPDGSGVTKLSSDPKADDYAPVWSPDGKMIAFTSNRDGLPQIYVMNADGSGLLRVSHGDAADLTPSWSPDGQWIAFTSVRNGATDIYIMDLKGDNVTRLTTTGGDHPMWTR
jgi:dipeptidyl aminopeptidase/acylaminoacyl peptidase